MIVFTGKIHESFWKVKSNPALNNAKSSNCSLSNCLMQRVVFRTTPVKHTNLKSPSKKFEERKKEKTLPAEIQNRHFLNINMIWHYMDIEEVIRGLMGNVVWWRKICFFLQIWKNSPTWDFKKEILCFAETNLMKEYTYINFPNERKVKKQF